PPAGAPAILAGTAKQAWEPPHICSAVSRFVRTPPPICCQSTHTSRRSFDTVQRRGRLTIRESIATLCTNVSTHRLRSPWPVCHRGSLTAQGGLLVDTTCIGDGDRRWTVAAPPLAASLGMLLTCARAAVRSHAGVPQVCASASEHPLFLGGRCSMRRADAGGSRPWAPGPASTVECRKGFCMPGL